MSILTLIVATFVSEDLTCITAGLLVSRSELSLATALVGCYLGIFLGDLGLWIMGRAAGAAVLRWPAVARRLPSHHLDALGQWFTRHGLKAVLVARVVPGLRFPTYVAAGAVGKRAGRFAAWAALAGVFWTPLLVGAVAVAGAPLARPLESLFSGRWIAIGVPAVLLLVALRLAPMLGSEVGRHRLAARVARIWRWEFWPAWLFYLPVLPWIAWLSLRHGGLRTITAANPGIPHGGLVGESKYDILQRLPQEWVVRSALIDRREPDGRVAALQALLASGWAFPLILKPDVGERGRGVRLVRDLPAAERYLRGGDWPTLVQEYHPGPFEVGIFYYRIPGEATGRVFSITEKVFAEVVGDGESTLAALIWRHPRYRMQAGPFLARLNGQANAIVPRGEAFRLVIAGNHCQGTLFRDGTDLLSPALEQRVDEISRSCEGFYFGRFDVRYHDPAELRAGRGWAIVELNGASSESTNLYDPEHTLWDAYRILYAQWQLLFTIGAANRARGCRVSTTRELVRMLRTYRSQQTAPTLSD